MVDIGRNKEARSDLGALAMLDYCLSTIEKSKKLNWGMSVVEHLSLEEVVGALVQSEYELKKLIQEVID